MDRFTKQYGKAICVLLYGVFAAMAVRKKPKPLLLLLAAHTAEYYLVARKVAEENGIPQREAAANCLAFGFTWWKPIKYRWN